MIIIIPRKTKLKEMKTKNDELKKVKEKRKELMNGDAKDNDEKGKVEEAQSKCVKNGTSLPAETVQLLY